MLDGTWKSQESWDGIKDGCSCMAPYTNMPDDVKAMAEDTEAKIKSGELHPFTGPDHQAGRHASGRATARSLDDGTLLGMNWYVKGIDDKLPQ